MSDTTCHNARVLDQEPDTIAIIPDFPDYIIVGTYSLVDDSSHSDTGTDKKGSLQILPFYADRSDLQLDRVDFEFGVYDVHFHPQFTDLLGVATSNAEILFFYVDVHRDEKNVLTRLELVGAGGVLVEELGDDGSLAIVTQFHFIELELDTQRAGRTAASNAGEAHVALVATTQFGNTRLIQCNIRPASDLSNEDSSPHIQCDNVLVHKQSMGLEAWTTLPLLLPPSDQYIIAESHARLAQTTQDMLILSGGDDSQLIISRFALPQAPRTTEEDSDVNELASTRIFTDRRTHEAGIVSLCSLGPTLPASQPPTKEIMILTGSYDEHIRLFVLAPPTTINPRGTFKLLSAFKMLGSVWRIQLLDTHQGVDTSGWSIEYLLLIAGHTAGALIVRLRYRLSMLTIERQGSDVSSDCEFEWVIEKSFAEHMSLVYAVVAKRKIAGKYDKKGWHVISASFYDKRICTWDFDDGPYCVHEMVDLDVSASRT